MKNILSILITFVALHVHAQFLLQYDKPASKFTSEQRENPNRLGYMARGFALGQWAFGSYVFGRNR